MIGILDDKDRLQLLRKVDQLMPAAPSDKRDRIMQTLEGIRQMGFHVSPKNEKLGRIYNFSLPAGIWFRYATCPGASELCEKICYATKGRVLLREYNSWANWAYVLLWPDRFRDVLIRSKMSAVFRIHVGGDFFDAERYLPLWIDIIKARPNVRFFAYTRSWRDTQGNPAKEFLPGLRKFAKLPNARLVLSVDRETGVPPLSFIKGSIRAWLAVDDKDMPDEPVELIFRHKRPSTLNRYPRESTSQENGTPVCPYERLKRSRGEDAKELKEGFVTCQNCAWCWGAGHLAYGVRDDDLSKFDLWSEVRDTLETRVADMFSQFTPWYKPRKRPRVSGPMTADVVCACSAEVPCMVCGLCVGCFCRCP